MKQIRAIIAEDEYPLREHLRKELSILWPDLIICGEASDGIAALNLIKERQPEIAFLDIKMPVLSGLEVAKRAAWKCRIVFITAYDEYAVQAFENEAIDYLLKPVTRERLKKTIGRIKEQMNTTMKPSAEIAEIMEKLTNAMQKKSDCLKWVKVKYGDGIRIIPVEDIFYFKAEDKYTIVRHIDGEYLIRKTITELSDELDPEQYWRIHRSTIVNISFIAKVVRTFRGGYEIKLKGISEALTVSRAYSYLFRQM
ncbi:MAG: response regulator transcription factor [Nitrospinae bacterium]|nr:response regulator transcription factor [Nitrospinota bacterium]